MHFVERDDLETPSLQEFCSFSSKHIWNALGDKNSLGAENHNKVRNFAFLKKFYETFNNHAEYVETLKEEEDDDSNSALYVSDDISSYSEFQALESAALEDPDEEYTGNITFSDKNDSDSDADEK